MRFNIL